MKLYTHSYGRLTLPQFQMFGFVLMALGVYLVVIGHWFGLVAGLIGFALFFTVRGNQINFEKRLFREFIDLMGFKYGKWITLPEIEYITVFYQNLTQRGSVASIDNDFGTTKVNVKIIITKKEYYDVGRFNTRDEAIAVAVLVAKQLNSKLLDYTEREPKWVDFS